ncbi:Peroxidase 48-like [Dorcoceras hygrometricum]|uniref:Peroxidase n=1 Tax=Dorcoceras hygrometricum TaxID=472368 RepID=A0A2Z7D907_9LAMI|nr:Peroxidase 48-like [Dorcoceras hygrometricum]
MDFTRTLGFLVFLLCVLISLKNQNAETNRKGSFQNADYSQEDSPSIFGNISFDRKLQENDMGRPPQEWLRYDYYNESCPFAEQIIRSTVRELYELRPDVAPALLRLAFHDCFVEGCDASVLLDATDVMESEKDCLPNESLKGYDVIDIIKSELEESCPGVVSCADIIVLAARESVLLAGGPFYPLYTGRKDSTVSFFEEATYELPSPHDHLSKTIESFATRGFDERETVSLLGAHSTGTIHCKFFHNRLYNFSGTDGPDPSLDTEFLEQLRSKCNRSHAMPAPSPAPPLSSPSPSSALRILPNSTLVQDPGMKMDYEGPRKSFGVLYYRSLLQGKGLLFVDQQLTSGEETETWVRAYASDVTLFQRDFGLTMIKLSDLGVRTSPMGQVRLNCRKVN